MKKLMVLVLVFGTLFSIAAKATDDLVSLPIEQAWADNNAKDRVGNSVKFYFGKQATPKILKHLGTDTTNLKSNAFGKTHEKVCNWIFLSNMLSLQKHAQEVGANAIINIVSNYKGNERSSETEFDCGVGGFVAGAAFKAEFVKIAE